MSKYIRVIEDEIATIRSHIDRHKGVGCYHETCRIWQYHLDAYERILELVTAEAKRQTRPRKLMEMPT